jgi:hypothetical protein
MNWKRVIIVSVVSMVIMYLSFSFCTLQPNPFAWKLEIRVWFTIGVFIVPFVGLITAMADTVHKKDSDS